MQWQIGVQPSLPLFNHLAVLLGSWDGTGAGDLNGDGVVGAPDLAAMLSAWGACP